MIMLPSTTLNEYIIVFTVKDKCDHGPDGTMSGIRSFGQDKSGQQSALKVISHNMRTAEVSVLMFAN